MRCQADRFARECYRIYYEGDARYCFCIRVMFTFVQEFCYTLMFDLMSIIPHVALPLWWQRTEAAAFFTLV